MPEDDLVPLRERLAGARLIGLGEATRGGHESFAFKCRLIQALVHRGKCGVVIFERGVAEMDALDAGRNASDAAWVASPRATWQNAGEPTFNSTDPDRRWLALLVDTFRQ